MRKAGALMIFLSLSILGHKAQGSGIESLVMPGPVSEAHAELEGECINCHEPFDKKNQTVQCLNCHTEINDDLEAGSGFHGIRLSEDSKTCKNCHTEHEGRDADIVSLDRETFNHDLTDFILRHSHTEVSCNACHTDGEAFASAQSRCVDCHKEEEPHRGRLGDTCNDCHQETAWSEVDFDHSQTDFDLKGQHAKTQCASCHINERYEDTPTECYACHELDDHHNGGNGTACGDCHNNDSWEAVGFDHDVDTDFPLRGAHQENTCASCHKDENFERPLETTCVSCHAIDDVHAGRNGSVCNDCHVETAWGDVKFDHQEETGFALIGRHSELQCQTCHAGGQDETLEPSCVSCHRGDDVHSGQLGETCERCHNASGWTSEIVFDHDLTRFPLIGLHAVATCESCHEDRRYVQEQLPGCVDCHKADDSHDGGLGEDCALCHNPNSWNLWEFDHNRQTNFQIDGAHEGLECNACHRMDLERHLKVATRCVACHRRDDSHDGRFGPNCQQCHTTDSFRSVTSRR